MKLSNLPQLSIALAFLLPHASCSVGTTDIVTICSTYFGTVSKSTIGSTTYYLTVDQCATATSTSTPYVTLQPAPTTITSTTTQFATSTKTLSNTQLSTFTSTSTIVDTISTTSVITATPTTTETDTTTVTPTTTIPTSPGFIPASDAPYLRKRAAVTPFRADILAARRPNLKRKNKSPPASFAQSVTCGVLVDIISTSTKVTTAPTATVQGPTSTITKVSTITSTLVSTKCSTPASTTLTVSSTIYVTSTVDTTTTTTASVTTVTDTVLAPSATFYAACADDNLLSNDPDDGGNLCDAYTLDNTVVLNTESAYDCCVACQQNSNCGGALFTVADSTCLIDQPSGTCDPIGGDISIYGCGSAPVKYIAIDGNCGAVAGT